MHHRVRVVRELNGGALAAGRGLPDRGVDQRGGLGLVAAMTGEHERAIRADEGPGRLPDRVGLGDQQRGPRVRRRPWRGPDS